MSVLDRAKHSAEVLRKQRSRLLKAFDIYKTNVKYGIEQESEEQHTEMVVWYQKCLDLDYEAINNPPVEVVRYL